MNLAVVSDVHTEFQPDGGRAFVDTIAAEADDVDVLVVAGDLGNFGYFQEPLCHLSERFPQVVYVHGNHECYGASIARVRDEIRRVTGDLENVHFLDNEVVTIRGCRFVGTTMWFRPHPAMWQRERSKDDPHKDMMNDFEVVDDLLRTVPVENAKALSFLAAEVRRGDVVVTHHAPCVPSVPKEFRRDPLSHLFYVCNQNDLIHERSPAVWIHGHIHDSWDYSLWGTRVVANPYGYEGEELNPDFDPRKRIRL